MNRATKAILLSCSCLGALLSHAPAHALPEYNATVAGSVQIDGSVPNALNINQNSSKAIVEWNKFNIGSGETVNVFQPSSQSILLNRVLDTDPSKILGNMNANGHVWIMNPGGVLFGEGAQVNVGGLIATTANIDNDNFMAGNYRFSESGIAGASIINKGTIDAGVVGLFAANVTNEGTIHANFGKVVLAATETFTVDFYGDGLLNFALDNLEDGTTQDQSYKVANSGNIIADAGHIEMTVAQGNAVVERLIEQSWTGSLQANSVGSDAQGKIVLGSGGEGMTTLIEGKVEAKGLNSQEKGGEIDILGDRVAILNGGVVDASGENGGGTIHIGGEYLGGGDTYTAEATVIQSDATIKANGDNGEVIIWSDEYTNFQGSIEASGGFVETSSYGILSATGNVSVDSADGNHGTWLLDPNNITIQDAGPDTNVSAGPTFTTTNDTAIVTTASIEAVLNAGGNVIVQTSTAGGNGEDGDITVANEIDKTGGGASTLTLNAHDDIIVNANIGSSGVANTDTLNVVLNADSDGNSDGYISIAGATIDTKGGNFSAGGGADDGANGGTAADGIADNFAWGDAGQEDGILINNSNILTGDGSITLRGHGDNATTGAVGVHMLNNGDLQSANGNVSVTGIGGDTGSGGHGIVFENSSTTSVITGSGNITLVGTAGSTTNAEGVYLDGTVIDLQGGGNLSITGDASSATSGANRGILLESADIDTAGTGTITLNGTGGNGGSPQNGIRMDGFTNITSVNGLIDIDGFAGAGTGSNRGVELLGTTSSTNGNIDIYGMSGSGGGTNNFGVYIAEDILSVDGNITILGETPVQANDSTRGIVLNTDANIVTTGNGSITLTGTSSGTGDRAEGISLNSDFHIQAGGTGDLTLTGTAGAGTDSVGITNRPGSDGDIIHVGSGNIIINGTSNGTDANGHGVELSGGAGTDIRANGTGSITITAAANGGGGAEDFISTGFATTVNVTDATQSLTLNADTINVDGTFTATSAGDITIAPRSAATTIGISGGAGTLNLTDAILARFSAGDDFIIGSSAAGTGAVDLDTWDISAETYNVEIYGGAIDLGGLTMGTGDFLAHAQNDQDLDVTGAITRNVAGTSTLTLRADKDILTQDAGDITSTTGILDIIFNSDRDADMDGRIDMDRSNIATNGGDFTAGGGLNPSTTYAYGTGLGQAGVDLSAYTDIQTGNGNISMRGAATGNGNGIVLAAFNDLITTGGDITLDGLSGPFAAQIGLRTGVSVNIRTATGDIQLTGVSQATSATGYGIYLQSFVESTGTGTITLNGTGSGDGDGIRMSSNGDITSAQGLIDITAQGSGTGEDLNLTGSATIDTTAGTTDINLNVDSIAISATTDIAATGDITITPRTATTTIGLGGGAGTLNLDDTELSRITATGSLIIGDSAAGTGAIDLDSHDYSAAAYNLELHGGSIDVTDIITGANTLTLNARTDDVTINQDTLALAAGSSIIAADDIFVIPTTTTTTIGLGGGAGTLNLTDAELAFFNAGDALVIGDSAAGTGAVMIDSVDISANGDNLEIYGGEITVDNSLTSAGSIQLHALNGEDIIVNSIITAAGGGDSLTLNATGDFTNNLGAGALVPGAGRFLVYSADVDTITYGGLTGDIEYSKTHPTAPDAGNTGDVFLFASAEPTPPSGGDDGDSSDSGGSEDSGDTTVPKEVLDPKVTDPPLPDEEVTILLPLMKIYSPPEETTGDITLLLPDPPPLESGGAITTGSVCGVSGCTSVGESALDGSYAPQVGDFVRAGPMGFIFESDENAIIKMTRKSALKVKKVFYSPNGKNDQYYDVKDGAVGFFSGHETHKGEIKTILPGIAIKVTGTCYIVDHDAASEHTKITLFGGGIELYVKGQLLKLKDPIQMISFGADGPGASGPVEPVPLSMGDVRAMFSQKPEIIPSREELLKCGVPSQDI